VRKSPYKQCLLSATLGPFALFHLNPILALALLTPTVSALAVSIEYVFFILGASATLSVVFGVILVNKHNRDLVKNFQHSTYYGNVSGKVVRREAADKDYHRALNKVRQRKFAGKFATYSLLLLCVIASGFILAPNIQHALNSVESSIASNSVGFTDSDSPVVKVGANYTIDHERQPIWVQSTHKGNVSASLKAVEYQNSSDGFYRPDIRLSCEQNNYSVSFSVNEVLGTDITRLSITSDRNQVLEGNWQLSENYYTATATNTDEMINTLSSAIEVTVAYRPFAAEAIKVSTFNLQGSAKAISVFKERCINKSSA